MRSHMGTRQQSGQETATRAATGEELPGLEAMLDELRCAPEVYRPSQFWEYLAGVQYRELADEGGFAAFKRSVNRHYFQFMVTGVRDPQFRAVARQWLRHPRPRALFTRLRGPLPAPPGTCSRLRLFIASRVYAVYVALLAQYAARRDRRGVFAQLREPELGRPTCVSYEGGAVSEDLCNSALEYTSILDAMPEPPRLVVELGPGYGRLAWVFLRAQPQVRYVLVDIPPGLAIAQRYLTELFPERRAFRFRRFDSYEAVAAELESAQLIFLTPNQLELIEPLHADLLINVSSLHEMRREQIERYFELIAEHCDGFFYTKQWLRSVNPFDDLVVLREDYPVPAGWRAVFDRVHPVQTRFFEALYAMAAQPAQAPPQQPARRRLAMATRRRRRGAPTGAR
jgi:putative sugar O-methyltransferase